MTDKEAAYDIEIFQHSKGGEHFRQRIIEKQRRCVECVFSTDPRKLQMEDVVAYVTEYQTYRETLAEFDRTRESLTEDQQ